MPFVAIVAGAFVDGIVLATASRRVTYDRKKAASAMHPQKPTILMKSFIFFQVAIGEPVSPSLLKNIIKN